MLAYRLFARRLRGNRARPRSWSRDRQCEGLFEDVAVISTSCISVLCAESRIRRQMSMGICVVRVRTYVVTIGI